MAVSSRAGHHDGGKDAQADLETAARERPDGESESEEARSEQQDPYMLMDMSARSVAGFHVGFSHSCQDETLKLSFTPGI